MTQPNAGGDDSNANANLNPSEVTEENKTPDSTDANANPNDEGKTAEQLQEERKVAVQEAIKNSKKAKEAESQLGYYQKMEQVVKNPDSLIQIHQDDPDTAEKLAQSVFGKSYQALLQGEKKEETPDISSMIQEGIKKHMESQNQASQSAKIDQVLEDFLIDKEIQPGTIAFRNFNNEFNQMNFNSASQAKRYLNGLYSEIKSEGSETPENNAPTMSNHGSMGKINKKPKVSDPMMALLKQAGKDPKKFLEYEKTK